MDCFFDRTIIDRSINGKIDPLEKLFLEEHLKHCTECKAYLRSLHLVESPKGNKGLKRIFLRSDQGENLKKAEIIKKPEAESEAEAEMNTEVEKVVSPKTREKNMSVLEVVIRGATAGIRAIPRKAIVRNILRDKK